MKQRITKNWANKKTIVIVVQNLVIGGIERVMLNLAAGLQQNNCDVHIVIFEDKIELAYSGNINIHVFKQHYRWIPRIVRRFTVSPVLDKFIIRHCGKPDLVLSNSPPVNRLLAYSKLNTYLVIHTTMSHCYNYARRNHYVRNFREKALKKLYTQKPVVCVSNGVSNDFIKLFKPSKKVQTIHNPIDVKFVQQMAQGDNSTNLNDYIVHVGRFFPEKRHDVLIKAYKQSNINIPLVLVGDGYRASNIKALVKKLNLENKVIFLGFQSNPYPVIKNAKLMVLCSDFEGLPMVINESLALGTPIISTNCPSGPNEILPKNNLVAVGDVTQLANKITDAIKYPTKYTVDLKSDFMLENQVKKYLELIKN